MKTNRTIAGWLTLLALSTLNLQPSVRGQTTVLNYDGGTDGVYIGDFYRSSGVIFSNAYWFPNVSRNTGQPFDGATPGPFAIDRFPDSYNNGYPQEVDPTSPIIAMFTSPVTNVTIIALDVGNAGAEMDAYDAVVGGNLVASTEVYGGGIGVSDFFTLTNSAASIQRVEFYQPSPNGSDGIVFDTLTFAPSIQLPSNPTLADQMFPIVTNDTAATSFTAACAGTNYLVGIQGDYVGSDSYQITAQLFGPDGTPVGARINPVPGHTGGNPFTTSSGTNLLMVWPDDYSDGIHYFGGNIMAQLLNPSGALIGSWFPITTASEEISGVIYGAGSYLVMWQQNSGGSWAIYGQIVSASGTLIGGNFLIGAPADGQQPTSVAAAFDGTNFLVAWVNVISLYATNVTDGVFVSPSGAVGTPFAISQSISLEQDPLAVVFNGTNYLVVWNLENPDLNFYDLYGRFVTPAGTFIGDEFAVATNQDKAFPGLAFDGANYLLCWNVNGDTTNANIECQFLNAGGQPMGPQFTPFAAQGSEVPLVTLPIYDGKRFVLVTSLSAGGFTPTNDAGIYGAFIPASTAPPQFCGGAICTNKQFTLSLTGTPGINYAIQMTTNLISASWTPVFTNSPTNGTFTFTDIGATNDSRFYRAVKQ